MGGGITGLLRLFRGRVPDAESNVRLLELATTPARWSAGHAVFDEIRRRLLAASRAKDRLREWQHHFEESCCKAMYNATYPNDPFDPGSAFFVVPQALGLARVVGVPVEAVAAVLAPEEKPVEDTRTPDALEQLAWETIAEILDRMPPEELRKRLSLEERLKGLSVDELLAALPPEMRPALAQRLKDNGSPPNPGGK
jgi:hypothetical protein